MKTVIVPYMTRQLPALQQLLGDQMIIYTHDTLHASSQSSIRTVQLPKALNFLYHLKLAFAATITGGLRTISHWTASISIEATELLKKLVPENVWIVGEVAAVTGDFDNPDDSKHLTCILREDVEPRANALNQCLIVAGALPEINYETKMTHIERLFDLTTVTQKEDWFRTYARIFLKAVLTPLVTYGVCMEAHPQNIVCRFDRTTKELKGFAYRDMGGLRLHVPTLKEHGLELKSASPESVVVSDDIDEVWQWAYHVVFYNHLCTILRGLGLQQHGGWEIVRKETVQVLDDLDHPTAPVLKAFIFQKNIELKCFLRMKLAKRYRGNVSSPGASSL